MIISRTGLMMSGIHFFDYLIVRLDNSSVYMAFNKDEVINSAGSPDWGADV